LTKGAVKDKQWSLCERIEGLKRSWQERSQEASADKCLSAATKQSVASISNAYASLAGLASPKTPLLNQSSYLSLLNTAEGSIESNRPASLLPSETLGELKRDKSQTLFNMYAAACAARNKPITENPNTLNNSQVFAAAVTHVSKLSRAVRIAADHQDSQPDSN
jgi:hypothetical protein